MNIRAVATSSPISAMTSSAPEAGWPQMKRSREDEGKTLADGGCQNRQQVAVYERY